MRGLVYRFCFFTILFFGLRSAIADDVATQWHFLMEEQRIQQLQLKLSAEFHPQNLAFTHVNLITMKDNTILPDSTVLVKGGRIATVGKSGRVPIPKNYFVIDGRGRYLMPGLTDMHVHNLVSSSQHLLNLATGITTVRDMDGFPWMLEMRKQISDNKLLAPNMYITGHILNGHPMGMYATVVKSPEEGRKLVQEQKRAGYDFIKIHNSLSHNTYKAILEESRAQKIDAVGHIPHDISVRTAIELGQRTLEHFKGYILDRNLSLTSENYVDATRNADVWNCPTFYNYRDSLRGDEARKLLQEATEMKYASWRDKKNWLQVSAQTNEQGITMQQNVLPLSQKIFKDLIPIGAKFITGTDSGGGYNFMVPGFSLHRELELFQESGLSAYETLKASTVNAADAMRRLDEFGTIETGKRADLLLLRSNPLQDARNTLAIEGIAVRGIWLSRKNLDRILQRIEEIYNPPASEQIIRPPTKEEIAQFLKNQDTLRAAGFVFRTHDLELQQKLLSK
jgi:imidazolonepropionase-like amidohydrolase